MAGADVATMPDALEPVSNRKLKRLRKVMSCGEEAEGRGDDVVFNGAKDSMQFGAENRTRIDSAEEILKRFGKRNAAGGKENEGHGGDSYTTKKAAVQTKIKTSVVDMARESLKERIEVPVVDPEVGSVEGIEVREARFSDNDEVPTRTKKKRSHGGIKSSRTPDFKAPEWAEEGLTFDSETADSGEEKEQKIDGKICNSGERKRGISGEVNELTEEKDEVEKEVSMARFNSFTDVDSQDLSTEVPDDTLESVLQKARRLVAGMADSDEPDKKSAKGTKSSVDTELPPAQEVDTCNDDATENMLEKARKFVAGLGDSDDTLNKSAEETKASAEIEIPASRKKKGKKEESRAREELHAESQRLLRESKVAFTAPAPVWKPLSSVLEKIKKRQLELGCSIGEPSTSQEAVKEPNLIIGIKEMDNALNNQGNSNVNVILDENMEVEAMSPNAKIDENGVLPDLDVVQQASVAVENVLAVDDATNDHDNLPGTPDIGTKHLKSELISRTTSLPNGATIHSEPIVDSQDLLCYSQLSSEIEKSPMKLLDENSIPRHSDGGSNKEKDHLSLRHMDQQEVYITATHVRALIDDEAEDEDEDLLAENVEEEEAVVDEEEFRDLIASTQEEKVGDQSRRAALHCKWLQQQDAELTEDIMERLKTGRSSRWKGRDRVVSCLDEEDWLYDSDSNQNDHDMDNPDEELDEESAPEDDLVTTSFLGSPSSHKRKERETKSLDDLYDSGKCSPEVNDQLWDEEEHDREILRQHLLEESEEQLSFLSPAEDESSREVFSLINKVNVASLKGKATLGHSEVRGIGNSISSLPSKLSFLRRSTSTSLPPASHKQGGSGSSRSFVFGRDDSNSSHGLVTQPAKEEEPANEAKIIQESRSKLSGHSKKEVVKPSWQGNSECGPSLFDLLRRQAADLNKTLQKKNSTSPISQSKMTHNVSVFTFKSSRSNRGTRGS